jgi:hypothetical protein
MDRGFRTSIDKNISELAYDVLGEETMTEVDFIAEHLIGPRNVEPKGIHILKKMIGTKPKRPVYYLNGQIDRLPHATRDVIRYAGDYIDYLVKNLAREEKWYGVLLQNRSLGTNIYIAKGLFEPELYDFLNRYNKFAYIPAKHEFEVRQQPHLFSGKDAVAVCLITIMLARKLIGLSDKKKLYIDAHYLGT